MIRRTIATVAVAGLVATVAPPAWSAEQDTPTLEAATASPGKALDKGTVLELGTKAGSELYIVQLEAAAVPARAVKSSDRSLQKAGGESAYRAELVDAQADLKASIRAITRTPLDVRYTYTDAINGIAVELTRAQALKVSRIEGVSAVQVDKKRELTTDVGPEWIGAPSIWDGSETADGVGTKGEGVLVGVLDSGINPANPSFADSVSEADGGDGYDHTNPFGAGNYVGMCDPDSDVYVVNWGCNDKLVGYWNFTDDESIYDDDGHGTHTASTSVGNQVDATTYAAEGTEFEFSTTETIKGVAPHANLIAYDVCDGGCSISAITAAIDQSITDGVDVINYSIGSAAASAPWSDPDAVGFLNARAAGIHVATSAGNDGPGAETVGSPADVPWITSVGATQHNRQWQAKVQGITADGGATLPDIAGVAFAKATDASYPIVDATALGSPQCLAEDLAGEDLSGQIIICTRGNTGRVEKGGVVADLGAEGMILANDEASGDSLNADPHELPAVHITYAAAQSLRAWMGTVTGERASLSGGLRHIGDDVADIMAAFSSRGANRAVSMISPSLSAPGVDILAGEGVDNETKWGFISGTSMASPHTAGALALLKGANDGWTPAEAQSALMTTAVRDIEDNDGTEADWFDMGSGRVDLTKASQAGLVLDVTPAEYVAADPAKGGDVRDLNTASMADNECLATCSWTRSLEATSTGAGTWTAAVENLSDGLTLSLDQASFTVAAGESADVTVTADVAGAPTDEWLFGTVVLTPPAGSEASVAHLPIAVLPSNGVLPSAVDITTRRDAGSQVTDGLKASAVSQLQISASGLVPEKRTALSIPEDGTNTDAFNGDGAVVTDVVVPAGATRMLARLDNPTAPDFDLYVGTGDVSEANVLCTSASGGSAEKCEIADPAAGTYWVLVQNWEASVAGGTDTTDLVTAVVAGDEGNLRAEGPAGAIAAGEPFSLRTFWDETDMEAGQTWQGSLSLGTGPGNAGNIGVIPVTVHRVEDDVTKTAHVATATPGDVVTYTVTVQPNVTPEDQTYSITDTLPAGMTYVEGSATGGATASGNTVSWSSTLPTTADDQGSYTVTTAATDDTCVTPFGDTEYVDLESLGIKTVAGVTGDTQTFNAFTASSFGFLGDQYQGLTFTDDGFLVYDAATNYDGEPWVNQTLPDPAAPNNVAAMLWQDMEIFYDQAANHGVSIAQAGDLKVIEFDNIRLWDDVDETAGSYDMEVFAIAGSNDLVFAYDNVTGPLDNVTIGTENAAGDAADTLVNAGDASDVITDGAVVCATYEDPLGDPVSFTYQATVGEGVHNRQVLTNTAVHTTSNAGAKPAEASASVTVGGTKERSQTALAINPTTVTSGGAMTARATVFTAGETPATGTVEFLVNGAVATTAPVDPTGVATAQLTGPAASGTYPVTARYSGDAGTLGSTSPPVNVVVTAAGQPVVKVRSDIVIKTPKQVKVGTGRGKVTFVVTAPKVTPSGKATVTIKGAGKTKKVTVDLDAAGKGKVTLPRYKRTGKVTVTVKYAGDAATLPSKETAKFRVVR